MIEYPQQKQLPENYIRRKINEFLAEDMPDGDKTAEGIYQGEHLIRGIIEAEEDMVVAGLNLIPLLFEKCDIDYFYNEGDFIKKSVIIASIKCDASELLKKERVFLNLIQRMSGIATMTYRFVQIARPYGVKILDTRKTTPGLRLFEKYSVCVGGGYNHRMDLSSGILIKDNHIRAAGGVAEAITRIKSFNFNLPVEIEVENNSQIEEALKAGVDGFLLDNMSRRETIEAVELIRKYPGGDDIFIESSGGINLNNLKQYVDTGINAVSVGALTHSVKAADIHIEFEELIS